LGAAVGCALGDAARASGLAAHTLLVPGVFLACVSSLIAYVYVARTVVRIGDDGIAVRRRFAKDRFVSFARVRAIVVDPKSILRAPAVHLLLEDGARITLGALGEKRSAL